MTDEIDGNGSGKKRRLKRTSRPCDACRRRKSRCITRADSSVCTMCEIRDSPCTFLREVTRRGRPRRGTADGGSRGDDADADVAGAPSVRSISNIGPVAESVGFLAEAPPPGSGVGSEGTLRSVGPFARPSTTASSAPVGSLGSEEHRFAELYGLTSDSEPILMRHRPYNTTDHEYRLETHSIRCVSRTDSGMAYPVLFHLVSDSKAAGFDESRLEADSIETVVRPFGPRLLRLYWLFVHPCFPLLDQGAFMEQFSASYRNINPVLLGAVYLKALSWWSYDSELSLKPAPDVSRLRKLTLDAIQNSFHRPRLASIQAMLVYLHCSPEQPLTSDHTFTRGITSQMLAVAEAMGLHLDPSGWAIPARERAERKRLSWALYMQDKWTALAYGRPSHITDEDWDVADLHDSDFDGCEETANSGGTGDGAETAVQPGALHFLFMVDLSKILSRVLAVFFTVKASRDQETSGLLEKAQPLLRDLAEWRQRLLMLLPISTGRPRQLCSSGYIHLCYYGVVINIFRRLVRSTALAPLCSEPAVLSTIRQQASQTAHEANSFVASLRMDHLESFWYFATPYLFALVGSFHTLLLVTALSSTERDYWRDTLTSLLWTLRVMSKASDQMRYAVNRLEGGILRGLEHALAVNINSPPTAAVSPDLEQLLQQLEAAQYTYSDYLEFGLQSFDWLHGVQI